VTSKNGVMMLAVVIPAIFTDACGNMDEKFSDENGHITAMHYNVESSDDTVLDIGMVDVAVEENIEIVTNYVDFLIESGLVDFSSNMVNGTVLYQTDALGNSLAKILITMQDGDDVWAYTDLLFDDFPANKDGKEKSKFTIVKN
jgi:hypothetical protein